MKHRRWRDQEHYAGLAPQKVPRMCDFRRALDQGTDLLESMKWEAIFRYFSMIVASK